MFESLLIANRGEIACRIIRTARALGLRTIAVYSEADRNALHVALADEAWHIGPAPARESYLVIDRLLDVARRSGAQAVHPGYGFLAENADFAQACAEAGLVFVGPPVAAIRAMGDKAGAKALMAGAGVPLVPGYHGDDQDDATLTAEAERIGFPLLVKASAGGGGKGMRVVRAPDELAAALVAARREALSAFGDDRLLLERYLQQPRHVEVQVFADSQGNAIHLYERDCSVQRRHQKVIEEAPAFDLPDATRAAMGEAAVRAARAIGYVGAGTVEFLLDADGSFYFMEMNTRLQVEHPVTEMITGQDLVAWQLQVAAGQPLPLKQEQVSCSGHAIEVRLYAEEPERDFLPGIGRLLHLHFPEDLARVDTGVRAGDEVSLHYDPMLAKLIVHGTDRQEALRRMRRALAATEVAGVPTNLAFLARVLRHEDFAAGRVDTRFIERHAETLLRGPEGQAEEDAVLAAVALLRRGSTPATETEPCSPWNLTGGWRMNSDNYHPVRLHQGESVFELVVHYRPNGFEVECGPGRWQVRVLDEVGDGRLVVELDGQRRPLRLVRSGRELYLLQSGRTTRFELEDPAADPLDAGVGGDLSAPMPGKIIAVQVEQGARVAAGTPLVVLEAMKMEHTITAPTDGVVARLNVRAGDQVNEGFILLQLETEQGG